MSFKRHPVLILKLNVTENPLNVFSTASPLLIIISDKKKKNWLVSARKMFNFSACYISFCCDFVY